MSGDASSSVLCLTDHECVSVWTSEEPEILHDYGDIRQRNINGDWQADYILDSCKGAEDGSVTLFLASKTCVSPVSMRLADKELGEDWLD